MHNVQKVLFDDYSFQVYPFFFFSKDFLTHYNGKDG